MDVIDELRRLGYDVFNEADDILYEFVGLGDPQPESVAPMLSELKANKPAALARLRREADEGWPQESLRYEARFGHRAARLYPFLGHHVLTPEGPAILHQVIEARCHVVVDGDPDHMIQVPADLVRPMSQAGDHR